MAISIGAIGDLSDFMNRVGRDTLLYALNGIFVLSAVMFAGFYGMIRNAPMLDMDVMANRAGFFSFLLSASVLIFFLGTGAQVLIARAEGRNENGT